MGSVTLFPVGGYTPAELMLGIESGAIDSTQRAALREAGFDFERPSRRQERLLKAYFRMDNVRLFSPRDRSIEQVAAVLAQNLERPAPHSTQVYAGLQSMAAPPGEGSTCGPGGYYYAASRSKRGGVGSRGPSREQLIATLREILDKEPEEVTEAEVKFVLGTYLVTVDSGDDIDPIYGWFLEVSEKNLDSSIRKQAERGFNALRAERVERTRERLGQDIDLTPARLKELLQEAIDQRASNNIQEYVLRLLKAYKKRNDLEGFGTLLAHDFSFVRLTVVKAFFAGRSGELLKEIAAKAWEFERHLNPIGVASDDLLVWPATVEILFVFSKVGVAEALSRLQSIASSDVNPERQRSAQEFLDQLPAPLDIPRRRE